MYQSLFWPGACDFKSELSLWANWLKEKIDSLYFKICQYELMLE